MNWWRSLWGMTAAASRQHGAREANSSMLPACGVAAAPHAAQPHLQSCHVCCQPALVRPAVLQAGKRPPHHHRPLPHACMHLPPPRHLDHVEVTCTATGTTYLFPASCWLGAQLGGGLLERRLEAAK